MSNQTVKMFKAAAMLSISSVIVIAGLSKSEAAELIIYESNECAITKQFNRETAQEYMTSVGGKVFPLRRIDIEGSESNDITLKEPITMTPTFVLVDQGWEITRMNGYPGRTDFLRVMNNAAEQYTNLSASE